ncbi:class I SAM-dependent DNA methyltransferase [Rheinheimera baltica]|uniref:class I SAM-dependent DNA methyltransferase n=1 Tax=Rheinheimera baltica TaxID=67576 RepID=UPI00041A39EB|nr:class I SAM-dependent methyltransferase [Rheinheimera baltica]
MLSSTALYTDLSGYYDLMCCDINYQAQSNMVQRLHQLFGNGGNAHLDLACGTGPHIRHFIDYGYRSSGLDIHQPMLDIAQQRCPEASFTLQNMCGFELTQQVDLITCFLYSIHYSQSIALLKQCIVSAYTALNAGGVFCFNAVDKDKICNHSIVRHNTTLGDNHFEFASAWYYSGTGEQQTLKLNITKTTANITQHWQDQHSMVALHFSALTALLAPYFDVQILAHDYDKIQPWDNSAGNALFVCVKRDN